MKSFVLSAISVASFLHSGEAVIQNRCNQSGLYAMTWDDGPAQYTSQLLDTLAQKKVRATFHLTTQYLTDPNIQAMIQRIASAGHLIGLRTEPDWNLFQMSDEVIKASIARQANVMASFIGYYPKFIRLPYNGYDDRVLRAVESTGAVVTQFNLETYDYTNDGNRVLNSVKLSLSLVGKGKGSFISIQHDGVQQSVAVAGAAIDAIQGAGYRLVTLDECLGLGDLTKNKKPLEGAGDDTVELGSMPSIAGGISPNGGGSAGGANLPDPSSADPLSGLSKNSSTTNSTTFAAIIAVVLAVVLQQI